VKQLFDRVTPHGIAPIVDRLRMLLMAYLLRFEAAKYRCEGGSVDAMDVIKPVNFIIVIDGESSKLQNHPRYNHLLNRALKARTLVLSLRQLPGI
jgi:hypothetical protein